MADLAHLKIITDLEQIHSRSRKKTKIAHSNNPTHCELKIVASDLSSQRPCEDMNEQKVYQKVHGLDFGWSLISLCFLSNEWVYR